MALSNYGELKTAIATLLNRSDLTTAIPDFVRLLEARVNRETKFRNRRMEATATLSLASGGRTVTLPTDFIESRVATVQSSPRRVLTYLTPDQLEAKYPDETAGIPTDFTIYADTLKVGPKANGAFDIDIIYYQRLTALSDDADANWLLTYHPDVYLYGSCIESAPYLGDDPRLQTWFGMFDRAAAAVAGDDARARWNGAPVRTTLDVTIV